MTKWQAVILVLLIALGIRLATVNRMGKTWDEGAYVEIGHKYTQLALKANFTDPFWYTLSDHPPLIRYVYGFVGGLGIKEYIGEKPIFNYNYYWPRMVSLLLGSATTIFIVLFGYKYFSSYAGFAAGIIFSTIPIFVGLSGLATLESFMMFFMTGTIYFMFTYLDKYKTQYIYLTGIFLGLSLLVKQSCVIFIPLLIAIYILKKLNEKVAGLTFKKIIWDIILIFSVGVLTIFLLWPMPFFHVKEFWRVQESMWIHAVNLPPPEVFFGRLLLVPSPYYIVMFLITTPLLLLTLLSLGLLNIDKNRTFIGIALIIWFLFPFLQSFYTFKQHGVRYIIELYAPFSIICAVGLVYINRVLRNVKRISMYTLVFVVISMAITLIKIDPYYLDYFNEVVGGTNNVYQKKLFQLGWWGQGIGNAAFHISRNESRTVTVAVNGDQPAGVMPNLKNIKTMNYSKDVEFDYIIVPYFDIVRFGFNENALLKKYVLYHVEKADKADLVRVYKKN